VYGWQAVRIEILVPGGEYEGDVEDVACLRLDVSEYAVEEDAVQQACPN